MGHKRQAHAGCGLGSAFLIAMGQQRLITRTDQRMVPNNLPNLCARKQAPREYWER